MKHKLKKIAGVGLVSLATAQVASAQNAVDTAMTTVSGYWGIVEPFVIGIAVIMVGLTFINKMRARG